MKIKRTPSYLFFLISKGGGMQREKTVVERAAEISDTKKQEMITMMMREQTSMAMKINKEQTRQEELVRTFRIIYCRGLNHSKESCAPYMKTSKKVKK